MDWRNRNKTKQQDNTRNVLYNMYTCLLFSVLMTAEFKAAYIQFETGLTNIYPSAPEFAPDF
jgi:hypothetical protein